MTHLHGSSPACPCGAENGITTVAYIDRAMQPDPCEVCGKPHAHWGDRRPWRNVPHLDGYCRWADTRPTIIIEALRRIASARFALRRELQEIAREALTRIGEP